MKDLKKVIKFFWLYTDIFVLEVTNNIKAKIKIIITNKKNTKKLTNYTIIFFNIYINGPIIESMDA